MTTLGRLIAVLSVGLVFHLQLSAQFAPAERVSYAWAGSPGPVRIADMDGDGDTDIACISGGGLGLVTWLENDGTGYFRAPHPLGDLPGVSDLDVGDLDADGDIDVVVSNEMTGEVTWAANEGMGGFGEYAMLLDQFDGAGAVELSDLDMDGDLDIIATAFDLDSVAWIENLGGGDFASATGIGNGADGAKDVVVGDIDGDSDADVLVAAFNDVGFVWYENDGSEQFGPLQTIEAADEAWTVELGDLDDDGDLDLIAAPDPSSMRWYANNGDGSFAAPVILNSFSPKTRSIQVVDLDDDGDLDVLHTCHIFSLSGQLQVVENLGGGAFGDPLTFYSLNSSTMFCDAADVNGDGALDLIYSGTGWQEVGWLRNTAILDYAVPSIAAPPSQDPSCVTIADLDADGDPDMVVGSMQNDNVNWFANNGDGSFGLPHLITFTADRVRQVAVADLDNDGDPDVLSASTLDAKVAWYANDGMGNFGAQQSITTQALGTSTVGAADMDGDGDADVISTRNSSDQVIMMENTGAGVFGAYQIIASGMDGPRYVALGDLDGDVDIDVAVTSWNDSTLSWYANNGDATFGPQQVLSDVLDGPYHLVLADLDGNATLDVVCEAYDDDEVVWFANSGAGVFGSTQIITSGITGVPAAGDLDADGDVDVIVIESIDAMLFWCANDGNGAFSSPQLINDDAQLGEWVDVADLDGDGDNEVVGVTSADHEVRVYENHADGPFRIRGRVFHDANSSGAYDTGEEPFPFIGVTSAPYVSTPFTADDGQYTFYMQEDTYTITSLVPDALWSLTTPSSAYTVTLTAGAPASDGNDFGYVPAGTVNALDASLSPLFAGCNGITNQWITWRNQGNTQPSGYLSLQIDALYTFSSAIPAPDSIVGGTLYWSYASLGYYEERSIQVLLGNPDDTHIGDTVVNSLTAHIVELGSVITTFMDVSARIVACAYDPNDKLVDPVGHGPHGVVDVSIPFFEYTVRFQNTGTATADNVMVRDELDPSLDPSTVQLIGTSHPLTDMRIEVDDELVFSFGGIQLPDSNANEPASHGFVSYRISPLQGTPSGTTISNSADIYFDLNAPVVTNTVHNLLIDCALFGSTVTELGDGLLEASPGESYQWYLDGVAIDGATSQLLLAQITGLYAVEIINLYGCVLLSPEVQVVIVSLPDAVEPRVVVFPNPFNASARLILSGPISGSIEWIDVHGRVVRSQPANGAREIMLERSALPSGMYLIRLVDQQRVIASTRVLAD